MTSEQMNFASVFVAALSAVIAMAALAVSIVSDRRNSARSADALAKAERANSIASGASELSTHAAVSTARKSIHEIALRIHEHTGGEHKSKLDAPRKRVLEGMERIYTSALEDLLNAYEVACGLYLDGKIDKERFRKHYHDEIQKVCTDESPTYMDTMKRPPVSKYRAVWKVYEEWHNLEK